MQQSVQDLKNRLNEIERKNTSLQNNVQVMLNEFKKTIQEMHRAEQLFGNIRLLIDELHFFSLRREETFHKDTFVIHGFDNLCGRDAIIPD